MSNKKEGLVCYNVDTKDPEKTSYKPTDAINDERDAIADLNKEVSENQMYKLELNSFMKLIETKKIANDIGYENIFLQQLQTLATDYKYFLTEYYNKLGQSLHRQTNGRQGVYQGI